MKELRILSVGIASLEESRRRTIAIASGKHKPRPDEPRVWFTSVESLMKVLSSKNILLLEMIRSSRPGSIAELAILSGRAKSNRDV